MLYKLARMFVFVNLYCVSQIPCFKGAPSTDNYSVYPYYDKAADVAFEIKMRLECR